MEKSFLWFKYFKCQNPLEANYQYFKLFQLQRKRAAWKPINRDNDKSQTIFNSNLENKVLC